MKTNAESTDSIVWPDVERAGNQLVGHQAPRPEDRGRRGERSDAERIEEHGDEACRQLLDASAARVPAFALAARRPATNTAVK